jgi:hypothetical protein
VKLRPGLIPFLTNIAPLYDLYIYTAGIRVYANAVEKLLKKVVAGLRIRKNLSRDDHIELEKLKAEEMKQFKTERVDGKTPEEALELELHSKSLRKLFPAEDAQRMIIVLDDSPWVWEERGRACPNLIPVIRWEYFAGVKGANENSSIRGSLTPPSLSLSPIFCFFLLPPLWSCTYSLPFFSVPSSVPCFRTVVLVLPALVFLPPFVLHSPSLPGADGGEGTEEVKDGETSLTHKASNWDEQLHHMSKVLEHIHTQFYPGNPCILSAILPVWFVFCPFCFFSFFLVSVLRSVLVCYSCYSHGSYYFCCFILTVLTVLAVLIVLSIRTILTIIPPFCPSFRPSVLPCHSFSPSFFTSSDRVCF